MLCTIALALSFVPTIQGPGESRDREGQDASEQWGGWRGPLGTGHAPSSSPPVSWSEDENVRWKVAVPGLGHGTPAVWGERVFVTSALPIGEAFAPIRDGVAGSHDNLAVTHAQSFLALAYDRASGEVLWQKSLREAIPHEGGHSTASLASASPVTDGERLFAYFGSFGLYALTVDGDLLWKRDFGPMRSKHAHGEGSSPVLFGESLVVSWDHEGPSFVAAFDKRSGEERWRVERPAVTSWATPIVVEHEGKAQVIVSGTPHLRSYDLASGDLLWQCNGLSYNVVASPVAADGMVFAGSSYEKQSLLAIKLDGAEGDLTRSENLAWMRRTRTPYVPSPLLFDGWLYTLHHYQGVLSRIEAVSGAEPTRPWRLPELGDIYASPVAAEGRIYITDREGTTLVLEHGPELRRLSVNRLEDRVNASLALSQGDVFVRGERFLYRISKSEGGEEDAEPHKAGAKPESGG